MAHDFFTFDKTLLLGSRSPRRVALIRDTGIPFRVTDIDFDETSLPTGAGPLRLARAKNEAYTGELKPDEILLTADTLVMLDGRVLGKPAHTRRAVEMLESLSGRWHSVVTGVCMRDSAGIHCFRDEARVRFKELSREEICYYVQHYMPLDKAGAYGIQEWIGLIGIREIRGSFYTIMGLPVDLVWAKWLEMNGY